MSISTSVMMLANREMQYNETTVHLINNKNKNIATAIKKLAHNHVFPHGTEQVTTSI